MYGFLLESGNMRKVGLGGVSPFDTRSRPNALSQLDANDTIFKRGESGIWMRFQPCPCPAQDRVPNCKTKGCYDGYIRSVEEAVLLREEVSWKVELQQVFTRYAPIHSVEHVVMRGEETLIPLHANQIKDDHFTVQEKLRYWYDVLVDYKVKMVEEEFFEVECNLERKISLDLIKKGKILLEVVEIFDEKKEPMKWLSHNFDSIIFDERKSGILRGTIKTYNSIKFGYKTSNIDPRMTEKTGIKFNTGEVDIVPLSFINLGEGDLITMVFNYNRVSQFVPFRTGNIDRLTHSPIHSIDNCYSTNGSEIVEHKEGIDFLQIGYDRIMWIDDKKPTKGFTVMYNYHPSFRITGFVEGGAGEDRYKPRRFKGKAVTSYNGFDGK